MTHRLLINVLSCLMGLFVFGQQEPIFKEATVIPPSPNATAFNKFIDIPVSHYTGVPNISVPIYTLTLPQLSLPISLNYHASGLKVGEHSSWVGAGWSLSAGGAINRTVRGLPDEYLGGGTSSGGKLKYGFLRLANSFFKADKSGVDLLTIPDCTLEFEETPPGPANNADYLAQGFWDAEPDLYHFSFPGGSGKFVFNRKRDIVKFMVDDNEFLDTPIDLEPDNQYSIWNLADKKFKIKDASGVIYTFEATEVTRTSNSCGLIRTPLQDDEDMFNVSSWQLTKMERGGNWINFTYVVETINYDVKFNEIRNFTLSGLTSEISSFCRSNTQVTSKRLTTITTSNGYQVDFVPSTANRLDKGLTGSKSLVGIKVSKDGLQILHYELNQGYFGNNDKLKLEGVKQISNTTTKALPGYTFEYYSSELFPATTSYQQDYWGYYNGAVDNDTYGSMIPMWKNDLYHANIHSKASREPALNFAKQGTLTKITYPTGGYTNFDYELHDSFEKDYKKTYTHELSTPATAGVVTKNFTVDQQTSVTFIEEIPEDVDRLVQLYKCTGSNYTNCSLATPLQKTLGNRFILSAGNYQLVARTRTGAQPGPAASMKVVYEQTEDVAYNPVGGLRVKRVKFHDPVNQQDIQKVYDYSNDNKSSGLLFTPTWIGGSISTYTPGYLTRLKECIPEPHNKTTKVSLNASPSIPIGTYQGSHIGYSKVQEISYNSRFAPGRSIPDSAKKNGMIEYEFINQLPTITYTEPYIPAEDLTHKNGKPQRQTIYKYSTNTQGDALLTKLEETIYDYNDTVLFPEAVKAKGLIFKRQKDSYCYECDLDLSVHHIWNEYEIVPKWYPLKKQTIYRYDEDGQNPVTNYQEFTYDTNKGHYLHTQTKMIDSEGDILRSEFNRDSSSPALITQRETFKTGNPDIKIAGERVSYHGGLPLGYQVWNRNKVTNSNTPGSDGYEPIKNYSYDDKSLLQESVDYPLTTVNRQRTAYLWAYNGAYVVAQISNITQAELDSKLVSIYSSRTDISANTTTGEILTTLVKLKNKLTETDQFITIYLYKSRYGLSETHDPNGRIIRYEYDEFGRLLRTKDHDKNVLQENEYNYGN